MNFRLQILIVLISSFYLKDKVNALNCYSCSNCSPGVNSASNKYCSLTEVCIVGQYSNSTIFQGCAEYTEGIGTEFETFQFCFVDFCNTNNYTSLEINNGCQNLIQSTIILIFSSFYSFFL